jgi:hypothetical protein
MNLGTEPSVSNCRNAFDWRCLKYALNRLHAVKARAVKKDGARFICAQLYRTHR